MRRRSSKSAPVAPPQPPPREAAALGALAHYAAVTLGGATPLGATPHVAWAVWDALIAQGLVVRRTLSTGEVYGHALTAAGAARADELGL